MGYAGAGCIAKTQYSFSTNPDLGRSPSIYDPGARGTVIRRAGRGGDLRWIWDDARLPRVPAADAIESGPEGKDHGLF